MAMRDGHEVIGIANGWAGLVGDFEGEPLSPRTCRGSSVKGGTLLGTARYNLDDPPGGRECVLNAIEEHVDALIAIGGDGTQRISHWLAERNAPVIGVPKTLDNDLPGTDYCIGFDTAISIVAESLDRLNTTAASHHRVIVVETMGRATGWVAALGGLAGGADMIVIPEFPITMDEIVQHLEYRRSAGLVFSIVVVAEGIDLAQLGGQNSAALSDGRGRRAPRGARRRSLRRGQDRKHMVSKFAPRCSATSSAGAVPRRTTESTPRASRRRPTKRSSPESSA
jgi:6-phosphofructokinase